MKRFITLLILFAATLQLSAQTTTATKTTGSRRPLWVGLDMGGTWQASDMKAQGGIGWSFTLSRYSKLDKTGPLYFGWRFRFLDGRNYGYTYHNLTQTQLEADPTLSTSGSPLDYAHTQGQAYANYRFRYDEFAYEIIVGSNGLRKHGVLLYGFGGIGATHWKTTTNQLDQFGQMYDYSTVNPGGTSSTVKSDLNMLWGFAPRNERYETVTNGSSAGGKWGIMPSAGFGLGYQFGNAVALGVEHRTTWALNDNIDGLSHDQNGAASSNKDLYNYDGLFVRWTFGGNGHSSTNRPSNPDNYSNNPPPPNPNNYSTNPPNNNPPPNNTTTVVIPNNPSNPTNYNQPPAGTPPYVSFTTPGVDPYSTSMPSQQFVVRVEHVASANQITLMVNNQYNSNFSFNPNTNTMVFSSNLQNGTNVFQVNASNQFGNASDVQTVLYNSVVTNNTQPSALPPTVTITNPASDPYTSLYPAMNVTATVLNVTSAGNIQVRKNGNAITNFSFDPNSHLVNFTANLSIGANLFEVIGTNSVGSASDNVTINYNPGTTSTVLPPVVTIIAPAVCPYTVKATTYTITANITNVTTASQVNIVFDNQPVTQFNFISNPGVATVSFPVTLTASTNPFSITGTNSAGTNTKSCEIDLKTTQTPVVVPPVVNITNPATSPYTSATQTFTVNASVLNVASQNEITVTMNNALVNSWTYNMGNHVLTLPTTLNIGTNVFTVTASNANGTDSKSTTIIYSPATGLPPVVNITNPSANPYITSTSPMTVTAEVLNVTMSSEITVRTLTGQDIPFSFNASSHLVTFTANLVSGANYYNVTGTNSYGTASDNTTIKYVGTSSGTGENPPSDPGNQPRGGSTVNSNTTISGSHTPINPGNAPSPGGSVAISLLVPGSSSYNTTSQELPVTMTVSGVNASSEISVRVNGLHVVNFTYNSATHVLAFTATLISGSNSIEVSASNSSGSASQTLTVNYSTTGRSGSPNNTNGNGGRSSGTAPSNPRSGTSTTTTTQSATHPTTETKPATTGGRQTTAPATTVRPR